MIMATLKQLKKAAEELNDILFEPQDFIDVDQPEQSILVLVKKAIKLLREDDVLTDETQEVVDELKSEEKPAARKPAAKEEPKETADEPDDTNDNEPKGEGLAEVLKEVEEAEKLADLREIAKEYPQFKAIRGKLASYKSVEELRVLMLETLTPPKKKPTVKKEEPEVKPEKKADKKPAAKKEKVARVKKEKPEKTRTVTRLSCVHVAIRELCKKGATMEQIMKRSDELYVEGGGKSNPDAYNVHNYTLDALIEFEVMTVESGTYRFL